MTIVQYRYHAIITISTELLILSDNKNLVYHKL